MANAVTHRMSVPSASAASGVGLAVLLILCWIGAFVPFANPTHAFVGLFTAGELHSAQALLEGTFWAFLFGLLAGAVISVAYNLLARLER